MLLLFAIPIGLLSIFDRIKQPQHGVPPNTRTDGVRWWLLTGCLLSTGSTGLVIISYIRYPMFRAHPAPLIFFRSVVDILLAVRLLFRVAGVIDTRDGDSVCRLTSGITQLLMLSSESWFAVISVDLLLTLTNPFTNYSFNMKRYHVFVWSTSFVTSGLLMYGNDPAVWGQEQTMANICWIRFTDVDINNRRRLRRDWWWWCLLFVMWVVVYYGFAVLMMVFGRIRLKRGISATFATRKRVLHDSGMCVLAYLTYWTVLFSLYICYISNERNGGTSRYMQSVFGFMLSAKGIVDVVVWCAMHDIVTFDNTTTTATTSTTDNSGNKLSNSQTRLQQLTRTDISAYELDVKLNPAVNMALRREIVYYTTLGIRKALAASRTFRQKKHVMQLKCRPHGDVVPMASSPRYLTVVVCCC